MFCPTCGKEIPSDEHRFCPACGLKLHGIMAVVENEGNLPIQDLLNSKMGLRRKDGMKLALLIFVAFTLLLTPLTAVLAESLPIKGLIPVVAVLGTMVPLVMVILSAMFLPKELKSPPATRLTPPGGPLPIKGAATINSLPEGNPTPASGYAPPTQGAWRDVEYSTPGSVTEGTTKLLKEDGESGK